MTAVRGPDRTPEEIDRALTTLAYYGGNSARAAAELGMNERTLRKWRLETHRDRYLQIAEREAPRIEAMAAQQARELIIRASEVEHSLIDVLNERITETEAPEPNRGDFPSDKLYELAYEQWIKRGSSKELSELAGTLQRVTTSKGINGTKLLELTGRPTSIVEHRDPRAEIRAMAREFGLVINSTATDDTPNTTPLIPESSEANAHEANPATSPADQPAD